MSEVHREVNYECPECGGYMFFDGTAIVCCPTKYVHRCEKCDAVADLTKKYPCVEME